ncbi:MAG: DUF2330 domain-containing protein [Myxococcota bacterium]
MLVAATPRPADACGGTFCDAGPQAMPVDQTGETIVFVLDETHVEAHIQIEYDPSTEAERFAWIIPVMNTPEFAVSSQQLMLNLQNSTVPSYGFSNFRDFCDDDWGGEGGWDDWDGCDGGGAAPGGDSDAAGGGGDDGATTGGGTEVISKQTLGAFDIAVVESQTAEDLMIWLGENDFYQDPNATPILQEYVDEGAQFVAVRLTNGADVGEIHPISLRYEGRSPCLPIRLTRIAAAEDMDIRAFFLAKGRAYPTNYRHVELNPLKLDWIDLGSNYKEVVTQAIDEPLVEGHGFVTEYAGPTDLITRDGLFNPLWDDAVFSSTVPEDLYDILYYQDLLRCDEEPCTGHPLTLGILASYLPVPAGLTAAEYYECIECFEDEADLSAWDGEAFGNDVLERIINPGLHAVELLDENPFVTRLYTTLSPHEMTEDPLFFAEEEPPMPFDYVDRTSYTSTRFFSCGGRVEMQLPEGNRNVRLASTTEWPIIAPDHMPWSQRVTEHMAGFAPVELANNVTEIDDLLENWNNGLDPSNSCHGHDDSAGQDDDGEGGALGGCGCRSDDDGAPGWMLMLFAALGLRRLSRRRAA